MKKLSRLIATLLILSLMTATLLISASAAQLADCAGKVSCDALNVREQPDIGSSVLTMLVQGDTVVILDKSNGEWYRVSAYGKIGYVKASYIGEIEAAKNFTATGQITGDDVRMRTRPTTDSDILGTYQSGTGVSVIGINNGWYKVQYDGKTGYIRSDFLDLTGGGGQTVSKSIALSEGQKIAEYAKQFEGYKYVYGAESPSVGFDCSGLMYYVYGQFGYSLSRTASTQYANNGTVVSRTELQPGDLLFFGTSTKIYHVGMYIGNDLFIHACDSKTGVIISTLNSSWGTKSWYGAKRIVS